MTIITLPDHITRHQAAQDAGQFTPYYNTKMTTSESIRKSILEALSDLDQSAILLNLPDTEFVTGGSITDACRAAGYDESGRVTVNNLGAWNMTVANFAEYIAPENEA